MGDAVVPFKRQGTYSYLGSTALCREKLRALQGTWSDPDEAPEMKALVEAMSETANDAEKCLRTPTPTPTACIKFCLNRTRLPE